MSGDDGFDEDLMLMDTTSTLIGENLISPSSPLKMGSTSTLIPEAAALPSTLTVFDGLDYAVFCTMLALSALIGVYFAFFAKQKQNTTAEYLMGGKNMGIVPVSLSLIAR